MGSSDDHRGNRIQSAIFLVFLYVITKKPIVKVTNLSKTFPPLEKGAGSFCAVDNISFSIGQGKVLGLLGPNGAGKSTTISMLLGVLSPTSGNIRYFGKSLKTHRSEILQHVTFASTYIKMPWRLTVYENLRVYAYMYGLDKSTFEHRAEKFLTRFGVWKHRHKTMNNLSAGQVTRVMLSKAFIPHPKVVLLDEPTASLDPDIAHQIRGFIKQQQQEFDTTILYTSHNMEEVTDVCDRVMFLKNGRIIANDTPDKLVNSFGASKVTLHVSGNTRNLFKIKAELDVSLELNVREAIFTLDETKIPQLISLISKHQIAYSRITMSQPSLEDYFLHISEQEESSS